VKSEQQCAVCQNTAHQRLAVSVNGIVVAVAWLCKAHALAVSRGAWALQVEPEEGGPWLDGRQLRH
jgi:ribosomal protein L37AE/L43A